MTQQDIPEPLVDAKGYYDRRYAGDYMENFDDLFESCRVQTVRQTLAAMRKHGADPMAILDYGCGQGRYIGVLRELFPKAVMTGCDISDVALQKAHELEPEARLIPMTDETVEAAAESFDLVISIEVLEHVPDARRATEEIARLLRPGGVLLLTTPCANRYSLEWTLNRLRGGLEPSLDGFGRFATDEPGHLRRLSDHQLREIFAPHGVTFPRILHRSHFFTTVAERLDHRIESMPQRWKVRLAMLDWHLLRRLPNGATMVAIGEKRNADDRAERHLDVLAR